MFFISRKNKVALVTGITGQDGSYLAELLLENGYEVYGLVRRLSIPNTSRIDHIIDRINLVEGDLTDQSSLNSIMKDVHPDLVFNLAAQSFVATSWKQPVLTEDVTGAGAVRVLEAARQFCPDTKIMQASSSEMYGKVQEIPQNEKTRFYPRSPYGCSKAYAFWMSVNYRESYGMFVSNAISFNHESERRGMEFVTRKITDGVAKIFLNQSNELKLGNLDAKRDWGHAKDYVNGFFKILQHNEPDDFVLSTGETHSVKEFVNLAFNCVGLDWQKYVKIDDRFIRPAEVDSLIGDYSKAKRVLGWEPTVKFDDLVKMMVKADIEKYSK